MSAVAEHREQLLVLMEEGGEDARKEEGEGGKEEEGTEGKERGGRGRTR